MIDRLQEKDIDQVAQIEAEIFSVPWSIKSFKDALASEQNIYLKAETDGQIVGYCGIWTSFESADLCNIAVKKEFRKAGLGQKLLEAGIQEAAAKGVERILLEVRQSNKAAIRLYEKKRISNDRIAKILLYKTCRRCHFNGTSYPENGRVKICLIF